MCYSTDFLVCINTAPRNNDCGAREFLKLLPWIYREIWHILKTLPWNRAFFSHELGWSLYIVRLKQNIHNILLPDVLVWRHLEWLVTRDAVEVLQQLLADACSFIFTQFSISCINVALQWRKFCHKSTQLFLEVIAERAKLQPVQLTINLWRQVPDNVFPLFILAQHKHKTVLTERKPSLFILAKHKHKTVLTERKPLPNANQKWSRISIQIAGLIKIRMSAGSLLKCCRFIVLSVCQVSWKSGSDCILQWREKWKIDPESVSGTGSAPKVNQFFWLVGPIITSTFNEISWLLFH